MERKPRILILGHSPLPYENVSKIHAPGGRTWHFTKTALDLNSNVLLIAARIPNIYDKNMDSITFERKGNLDYYSVENIIFEDKKWLKEKISAFNPDCVVGVTAYPASVAADLDLDIPFWADIFGSIMAEAQAKAFVYNDNSYLHHFFKMESKVLGKADIFSVVSESQGFGLVGELGIWGRLSKETMGYRFVRVIPASIEPDEFKHTKNVIREKLAKKSDFVVLYTGGYNTWTDVDTLFHGLENTMSKNKDIVFVSTGGQLQGHDEQTYENFKNMINTSQYKKRFHLCGWVPKEDLPNYYLEADLAINSDKFCYEAILGSRTRVLEWLCASLPFISTNLSEITNYLIENNLAYGFQQGNIKDLTDKIISISSNKQELVLKKDKLKQILVDEFSYKATSDELLNWLKKPTHSPDHGKIKLLTHQENQNSISTTSHLPMSQNIAISLWPYFRSILRLLNLEKHDEKLKKFGERLVIKKSKKTSPTKYTANFLDVQIPEMTVDEKYVIQVKIKNTGNVIWETPSNPNNTVNFSYIWKDKNNNVIIKSNDRSPLPKALDPGKSLNVEIAVMTPSKTGEYLLQLDLIKEKHFWFSETGSKSYEVPVNLKKKNIFKQIKKFPPVSVIVVSYNSENFISPCIDSILKSDYPKLEIVVVDNNSKDKTITKLEKYKNDLNLIKSKKNLGFASGNNLGIRNCKGEIIILINPDAFVTKDAIRELVLPMLEDENIMITGSKILYPNTTKIQSAGGVLGSNGLTQHIGNGEEDTGQYDFSRTVDYVTGAAMAIRKTFFEKSGLFDPIYDPAYFEELDKCIQAKKMHYKVVFSPKSVVYHHESTTTGKLSKSFLELYHKNRFNFVYKNYDFISLLTKFIPSEISWFGLHCAPEHKNLVVKAHLKTIFSLRIILKRLTAR